MSAFLIRKPGSAAVLLKVRSRVGLDAETRFLRKYCISAFNQIKNPVSLVLMRKLCRVKIELKMLYANRTNYLNCFVTCILASL